MSIDYNPVRVASALWLVLAGCQGEAEPKLTGSPHAEHNTDQGMARDSGSLRTRLRPDQLALPTQLPKRVEQRLQRSLTHARGENTAAFNRLDVGRTTSTKPSRVSPLTTGESYLVRTARANAVARPLPTCAAGTETDCCEPQHTPLMGTANQDALVPTPSASGYCAIGRGGGDFVVLGGSDDVVRGDDGQDFVDSGAGADLILGGAGGDFVQAGSGDDRVWGGDGEDALHLGDGSDYGDGGPGHDAIFGGEGDDTLIGSSGNDDVVGGPGHDVLSGGEGDDVLLGAEGDDRLLPGPGVDLVYAGLGDDVIVIEHLCELGPGSVLDGGPGHDVLWAPVATLAELAGLGVTLNGIEGLATIPASCHSTCAEADCDEDPTEDDWRTLCVSYCERINACLLETLTDTDLGGELPTAEACKTDLGCDLAPDAFGTCDPRDVFESQVGCIFGTCDDLFDESCEVPSCD